MAKEIVVPNVEDVLKIAKDLNMDIDVEMAYRVIDEYVCAFVDDNTSMWFEIVENILYEIAFDDKKI